MRNVIARYRPPIAFSLSKRGNRGSEQSQGKRGTTSKNDRMSNIFIPVTDFASLDFGSHEDYDSEKKNKAESEKIQRPPFILSSKPELVKEKEIIVAEEQKSLPQEEIVVRRYVYDCEDGRQ